MKSKTTKAITPGTTHNANPAHHLTRSRTPGRRMRRRPVANQLPSPDAAPAAVNPNHTQNPHTANPADSSPTMTSSSSPSVPSSPSSPSFPSFPSVDPSGPRPRRRSPFTPLPEFAHLSPEKLDYIHDLLRDKTLAEAQQQLHFDLGIQLSTSTLHRYRALLYLADQLEITAESASSINLLLDLLAGREARLDSAGLHLVTQRALALAADPKTSPSLIVHLHRIFTYEHRKAENTARLALRRELLEHRKSIDTSRQATRDKLADHRIAADRERLALEKEKIALERERLALDLRKQQHREQSAHNPSAWNQTELDRRIHAILNAPAITPPAHTPPSSQPAAAR